jgi:hypothetical protein
MTALPKQDVHFKATMTDLLTLWADTKSSFVGVNLKLKREMDDKTKGREYYWARYIRSMS